MKKMLMLAGIAGVCMLATGLAARHSPAGASPAPGPYDEHLRYYEEIRPALVGITRDFAALCGGEPAARGVSAD